ncbi:MAG: hypothetical protein ABI721_00815 [Candidatus Dojkabacteria bacterium]
MSLLWKQEIVTKFMNFKKNLDSEILTDSKSKIVHMFISLMFSAEGINMSYEYFGQEKLDLLANSTTAEDFIARILDSNILKPELSDKFVILRILRDSWNSNLNDDGVIKPEEFIISCIKGLTSRLSYSTGSPEIEIDKEKREELCRKYNVEM